MSSKARVDGGERRRFYQEYVCGLGAATFEILIMYPMNKVMFRQQLYGIQLQSALAQLRAEGHKFLYRGLLPPLIQRTSSRALMFGTYEEYQKLLGCPRANPASFHIDPCRSTAAFLAGSTEALLTPFERIQTLLQHSTYHNQLKNTWDAFRHLRPYGLREYYRGLTPILFRNGPSNILYFALRGPLKESLHKSTGGPSIIADFVSGALLGASLSTIYFPLNVVKTRMQSTLGGEFISAWTAFRIVLKERNYKITMLYRGAHLNFTRSLVGWGITNAAYEILENYLFE